eukprot:6185382-Pleurochrysis_carterae.AAC.3
MMVCALRLRKELYLHASVDYYDIAALRCRIAYWLSPFAAPAANYPSTSDMIKLRTMEPIRLFAKLPPRTGGLGLLNVAP